MRPDICPHCGAEVSANARACPECGSDEQTGWSDAAATDHLGLPDEQFDYQDFVQREFGAKKSAAGSMHFLWYFVAIAALIAFVFLFVF